MNLIPNIISALFSVGFLVLLLLFAWRLVMPLLMIFFVWGLFNFFRGRPVFDQVNRFRNAMPGNRFRQQPRQTPPSEKSPSSDKIIDVDYTELP